VCELEELEGRPNDMGAMKQLQMEQMDRIDRAMMIAHNLGVLDKCEIHEEYVNPNGDDDDFFEKILHLWHEKNLDQVVGRELADMHIESRMDLMEVFEEALCQPTCCHSCEKNASE
jgi:hypothetical protein